MSFNFDDIQWDIPQDNSAPASPPQMPDNINWSNVLGQVGDAMVGGIHQMYQNGMEPLNSPGPTNSPPPEIELPWWASHSDTGFDPQSQVPQPTSPNDTGFNAAPNTDWGVAANKYNSYWLDGPQNISLWDRMWQGVAPKYDPPTAPPTYDTYSRAWDYLMNNNLFDPYPELPTLPPGTSW